MGFFLPFSLSHEWLARQKLQVGFLRKVHIFSICHMIHVHSTIVQKELRSCIAIDELPFLINENTCFNLVIAKLFNKL